MAEIAPSAGGGGGGRRFLLIIGGLAAVLIIGLLVLAAIVFGGAFFGGGPQIAVVATVTPTRIVVLPTNTRTPVATATRVLLNKETPVLTTGERAVVLELGDDNTATMTTYEGGKNPFVQTGTWDIDAAQKQLTLTFITLNGKPFKDTLVLQVQNGVLVPISFNRALHGDLSNIQIKHTGESSFHSQPSGRSRGLSMPAAQATATPNPISGGYSGSLPPVAPGEHLAALSLNGDNTAVMSITEAGKPSTLEVGTWQQSGSTVTVNFADKDGSPTQDTLTLELNGDELVGSNYTFKRAPNSPAVANNPAVGTWLADLAAPATATPIPITATPIAITATPTASNNLPPTGMGEDLLMLFAGGLLLLGVIVVVRRMRSA